MPLFYRSAGLGPVQPCSRSPPQPTKVGSSALIPDAASLAEWAGQARHHIGRFSTPQKRYFALTLLAERFRLFIVGMAGAEVTVASYPPRYRARVFSVPNPGHAMCVIGAGFAVNGDRTPAAWPLVRRQGRRSENSSGAHQLRQDENLCPRRPQYTGAQGLPRGQRGPWGSPRGRPQDMR